MFNTSTKNTAVQELKDTAHDVRVDLQDSADQVNNTAKKALKSARYELSCAKDKVAGEIRSNPVRSSVIALGVGALFGALLRRS